MERDFHYLVEMYGTAGAREKFENIIASALNRLFLNEAHQVAVSRGDGGIDVFRKSLNEPIIYQCKFFLENIGDSQRQQIRESFNVAVNNYPNLEEWVLCVPKILSESEHQWFSNFKEKNKSFKINLYDKTALLNLLKDTGEYHSVFNLITIEKSVLSQEKNITSLFNLAFFGVQFSYLIDLLLYDRKETANYCEILQNGLPWVNNPQTRERLNANINAVREFVDGPLRFDMRFENESAYYWCKEIESCVITVQDTLRNEELPYFITGKLLGSFNAILDSSERTISEESIQYLLNVITKLNLSAEVFSRISEHAFEMAKISTPLNLDTKKVNAPTYIYEIVSNYICL